MDRGLGEANHKSLKTNATGTYYTENLKLTNVDGNRSISWPDIRNFYYQSPNVARYHGSAMSAVMI